MEQMEWALRLRTVVLLLLLMSLLPPTTAKLATDLRRLP